MIPINIKMSVQTKKGSKPMYDILNTSVVKPKGKDKWARCFEISDKQWKTIYYLPFLVSKDSKLQWFQYRINHHILTTNSLMYKIGITDTNKGTFCKEEEKTIYHLIWECPIVERFLEQLHSLCLSKDIELNLSDETFIFGQSNKNEFSELFNIMLMLIKQYIYRARCQNTCPSIKGFLNIFSSYFKTLKYNAHDSTNINSFNIFWQTWSLIL